METSGDHGSGWSPVPQNPVQHADLENGLQSMMTKDAIIEIALPSFYTLIILLAKDLGGLHPFLNFKTFNALRACMYEFQVLHFGLSTAPRVFE